MSLTAVSVASADIYPDVNDPIVIRLSNVPSGETFRILITDKMRLPFPARLVKRRCSYADILLPSFFELVMGALEPISK